MLYNGNKYSDFWFGFVVAGVFFSVVFTVGLLGIGWLLLILGGFAQVKCPPKVGQKTQ